MSTNELCFTAFYCHSKTKDNSLNEDLRVSAIESFECDEKSINLIFALTNGCVMFGSYDRFHKKFDESRFYEVKVYEYPNCYVTCMASDFKSKPKFIYFGLSNGVFVIFSIETKSVIYSKRIHKGTIVSVASTDDAIFSGGYDGNLYEIKLSQESLFQHKLVYSNLFPINGICTLDAGIISFACGDGNILIMSKNFEIKKKFESFIKDINGMIHIDDNLIVYGGNGLQTFLTI